MKHVIKKEVNSTGYCDAPYCNINHTNEFIVCSCGFKKSFCGDEKDFEIASLKHIMEASGIGSIEKD